MCADLEKIKKRMVGETEEDSVKHAKAAADLPPAIALEPYNSRYVEYARSHGKSPEEMLEADRVKYPGGSMCGFILWNTERLRECEAECPEHFFHGVFKDRWPRLLNHEGYDSWLHERVNQLIASRNPDVKE